MFSFPSGSTGMIFPVLMGCLAILMAVFDKPLMHFLRITPGSEAFTIPKFQRSARVNEALSRLFLAVIGTGFIIYGAGSSFMPFDAQYTILFALSGLLGLLLMAMLGIALANWRA